VVNLEKAGRRVVALDKGLTPSHTVGRARSRWLSTLQCVGGRTVGGRRHVVEGICGVQRGIKTGGASLTACMAVAKMGGDVKVDGGGSLEDLRVEMKTVDGGQGVDAFIVPSEDPHMVCCCCCGRNTTWSMNEWMNQ